MIAAVNMEALRRMRPEEFARTCARLSAEWEAKGCPSADRMPMSMQVRWAALRAESTRRGTQLRLFEL